MKDRKKGAFLKHLKDAKGIISYACEKVGVSRSTYYNWHSKDADFKEKADEITEAIIDTVESKLLSKIQDEDLTAIIFFLKTKGRDRGYVERREQEVSFNQFEQLMKDLPDDAE